MLARHVTLILGGGVRTGVRIVNLAWQRLGKYPIQPALRRQQPLDSTVDRAPLLLEAFFGLRQHEVQVERTASPEVNPRIRHAASVAGSGGGFASGVTKAAR